MPKFLFVAFFVLVMSAPFMGYACAPMRPIEWSEISKHHIVVKKTDRNIKFTRNFFSNSIPVFRAHLADTTIERAPIILVTTASDQCPMASSNTPRYWFLPLDLGKEAEIYLLSGEFWGATDIQERITEILASTTESSDQKISRLKGLKNLLRLVKQHHVEVFVESPYFSQLAIPVEDSIIDIQPFGPNNKPMNLDDFRMKIAKEGQ